MINLHAGAVVAVRDGFTGRAAATAALLCSVDGEPYRPIRKDEGYLVFMDLSPGVHTLRIQGGRFQPEELELNISPDKTLMPVVTMKPGESYPFAGNICRLEGSFSGEPETVVVAGKAASGEVKIAQDGLKPGDNAVKLYCRTALAELGLPRSFLAVDGAKSEVFTVLSAQQDEARLSEPVKSAHKRGVCLYPCQIYKPMGGGFFASFRESVTALVFAPGSGRLESVELSPGENSICL